MPVFPLAVKRLWMLLTMPASALLPTETSVKLARRELNKDGESVLPVIYARMNWPDAE